MLDATLLSRVQFAFTIAFHILFPTLNIGLATFIAIMEGCWLKTQNPVYYRLCRFWTKIFALTFGMGVVSGIVMSYQLGTNFARFTNAVGPILGPMFGYEVLSAFFLEAGFIGVMVFGWKKVSSRMHFFATLFVAVGTSFSATWIMAANSWMQTPAGFVLQDGIFQVTSWWQAIFNPSFVARFIHMIFSSYITASLCVAAVSAWYLLKDRHVEMSKKAFSVVMWALILLIPAQALMGDMVGLIDYHHQPMKTAAMEGNWEPMNGAPLLLFAIPDADKEMNHFEVKIPYLASLINTHSLTGYLPGLKEKPAADRPPVGIVFWSFRVMVGIGGLFLLFALTALLLRRKGRVYHNKFFLKSCLLLAPLSFIASLSGWVTAEVGRQPWTVYGLLRTGDSDTIVPQAHVALSLTTFVVIYTLIFGFYLYYLFSLIRKGLDAHVSGVEMVGYMTGQFKEDD